MLKSGGIKAFLRVGTFVSAALDKTKENGGARRTVAERIEETREEDRMLP